ncbi:ABC transporter ATP-binding protein [Cytophaga hutchinsonii]|jgi:putative ABC transport system ATP-binding protein|uniref:ABC transporter, ATP-binding protein n=1 Tax=Cytophaga hutchinsonii (strain ATCC 33406 / DSM 1761 / CIP 103989 / NBRC 15051 / NCIMB 9469 / D465) TaxID=269798 RepID=A0A6N4SU95_CYTH3|nr:ABC transporter ATP-binding protein [Cytophaga hutchinsonii]ABG59896.1 ABC transporter, ATP-binding protein [Cytophaga hutchinsonii ATCC 33406]SFX27852.1 putative ABC transport system ATP-binding protein [Cytophaga hutchinsonii ATCC 33406]
MVIAELKNASKEYQMGDQTITALQSTNFKVNDGELLLIIGPSGSGKTTLLSLIGCVIYPSKGELTVDNEHVNGMSQSQMARLRLNTIGFVFQNFNLIAPLNAFDNVILPLQLQGVASGEAKERTEKALEKVGMLDRKKNLPKQLSGGQQQRIAIARALVTNPKIILCDEPTASLDKDSVSVVMNELKSLAENGKAVVVVTHDPRLKEYAHRIVEVKNGTVTELTDLNQNL